MQELTKTFSVIGAALLLAVAAFLVARESPDVTADIEIGRMFVDLEDPHLAGGLKIVKFDPATAAVQEFEVARVDGVWSIPSHQNYPADAEQHLVNAATSVMHVEILDIATDSRGAHEEFGVLDPTESAAIRGATGVGDRVTLRNVQGDVLADFIIGHAVRDQPAQRYVRRVGRDHVYVVRLDPSRLSTSFSDWIEEDLLKLNPYDIKRLTLADYSVHRGVNQLGRPIAMKIPKTEITLGYDDFEDEWELISLQEAEPVERGEAALREVSLQPDERLNTANLHELRMALDDLKIVDVERKPAGLKGRTLEQFLTDNPGAFESLFRRGFAVRYNEERQDLEVISDEGDITVGMKDGVEYVLRFGTIAGGEQRAGEAEEEGQPAAGRADVLRYLWVVAQVNESLIDQPEFLPLPEEQAPAEESPADESPQEPLEEESPDDAESPAEEPPVEEQPSGPEGDVGNEGETGILGEETAEESFAEQEEVAAEDAAADPVEEEPPVEEPADPQELTDPQEVADGESDVVDISPDEQPGPTREEIEQENQRRQEAYLQRTTAAQERVDELNARFADWYFVISNDVYELIHLSRDQVIERAEAEEISQEDEPGAPEQDSLEEFDLFREALPE